MRFELPVSGTRAEPDQVARVLDMCGYRWNEPLNNIKTGIAMEFCF